RSRLSVRRTDAPGDREANRPSALSGPVARRPNFRAKAGLCPAFAPYQRRRAALAARRALKGGERRRQLRQVGDDDVRGGQVVAAVAPRRHADAAAPCVVGARDVERRVADRDCALARPVACAFPCEGEQLDPALSLATECALTD